MAHVEDDDVMLVVQEVVERSLEENVKIVEVDDGSEAHGVLKACVHEVAAAAATRPSRAARRRIQSCTGRCRSALTDSSTRTLSGRFGDEFVAQQIRQATIRASLDLLGAHWSSATGRVERCASRARVRSSAYLPGSECGSSAWRD
ncbi:hypothetical protein EJB05_53066, partial [Eragrostis curvula]